MRVESLSPSTVFQSSFSIFGTNKLNGSRPYATFSKFVLLVLVYKLFVVSNNFGTHFCYCLVVGFRRVPISCAVRFRPCIDIHKVLEHFKVRIFWEFESFVYCLHMCDCFVCFCL